MNNYETYFKNGEKALKGLETHGVAVGLLHVTKANYEPVFLDAKAKHRTFNLARLGKTSAYITVREKRADADKFLSGVRNYLTGFLGDTWSPLWTPLGFLDGSLKLPDTDAGRCQLLDNLTLHFTDYPEQQNASKNYTSAYATTLCAPLRSAVTSVSDCKFDTRTKKNARDAALKLLDKKLADLRRELETLLTPLDPRWLKFFDRIPGDLRVPERVEAVTASAQPGVISIDWEDATRAARYKVLKQVVGTDADFVVADTVDESEAELTGVPAGATVKLKIVPLNGVGEGAPSVVLTLQAA